MRNYLASRTRLAGLVVAFLALTGGGLSTAADLCPGAACSISMNFAGGGSLSATQGATVTFGTGGSLVLGDGGSITLGEGGSVTPDPGEGGSPDMSAGGTLVLGPGGMIQFGSSGSLVTGDSGGASIAESGTFNVSGATSIEIDSEMTVRLGSLSSDGDIEMTAADSMQDGDTQAPFNFALASGNPDTQLLVSSGADISWYDIQGDPQSINLSAGEEIVLTDDGSHFPDGSGPAAGPSAGCGGESGSGSASVAYQRTLSGSSTTSGCGSTEVTTVGTLDAGVVTLEPQPSGGGGIPPATLVLLVLAATLRLPERRPQT